MAFIVGDDSDNTLKGTDSNDFLTGNGGDDRLIGLDGSDQLRGGTGADYMVGGTGHDAYWIDNINDIVVEKKNEGADRIWVYLDTFQLSKNFENLGYIGEGNFEGIGNNQDNQIRGGIGNDTLIGHGGLDMLMGEQGNDVYVVDWRDDIRESADNGIDTVHLTHGHFNGFYLADNVENAANKSERGANIIGNELDNRIIGNSKNDSLTGEDGNDALLGKGGKDDLRGGDGNDTFNGGRGDDELHGDLGSDLLRGGAGTDSVYYNLSGSGVHINMKSNVNSGGYAQGDRLVSIENVVGSSFSDIIVGSNKDNTFHGGKGSDLLKGNGGDDVLLGGKGNDILVGGTGADEFVFGNAFVDISHRSHLEIGIDKIRDFEDGDKIDLRWIDASKWGLLGAYQDFSWIGTDSFSGDGAELRYFTENGNTVITGDVSNNSNGSAEFRIELVGKHDLSEGDFLM